MATLVLQLRHPRDRLRRLFRRPGTAACYATTIALAIGGGVAVCGMLGRWADSIPFLILAYGLPVLAGSAVTAVWTLQMMVGRYRAASDWIDRLGRLMGFYWVMTIPGLSWAFTI